ncbi:methyltransferase [Rhodothermus profundi]|uniref:Dimerisation domain-containing protein n=1 Tax=Rhodothermus profundi TaxID=633813 RepID=A0A1M6SFS9_9BACT|nr:methyltransferase [Rhodothermus profundi]SHK43634.1 Dimerisation domain-containing protein [Rhodothermus profundi]
MVPPLTPAHIMQIGMGFWASQTLLTAVKLGLFSTLHDQPLTGRELQKRLHLQEKGLWDFLDALVSLHLLERDGVGPDARYRNTAETARFLDRASPAYMGGLLEMANDRLYEAWGHLATALQTGRAQNETNGNLFTLLIDHPDRLRQFVEAMEGIQRGNFIALAEQFDFTPYRTFCDMGGASGLLALEVARRHPHLACTTFDLPEVSDIARQTIARHGMDGRVTVLSGDFFQDDFPQADVMVMGNILHDWNLDRKLLLMDKAYRALPEGGAFIAIENIIDDARRENTFGLLMSLNMLIETGEGFDYTGADFNRWARHVGFRDTYVIPLTGPTSAAVALK